MINACSLRVCRLGLFEVLAGRVVAGVAFAQASDSGASPLAAAERA